MKAFFNPVNRENLDFFFPKTENRIGNNIQIYEKDFPDLEGVKIAIIGVEDGSPASKAGLKKGDIIVKLGDKEVGSLADFRYELYKHEVGESIKLSLYRDGKLTTVDVTLGKNTVSAS